MTYKVGDRMQNVGSHDKGENYGKKGVVTGVTSSQVHVEYDDGETGSCSLDLAHKYYQVIGTSGVAKTMTNIIKFAKNLVLSADEKLLRKHNLKDDCGDYTSEARELVLNKLIADNEAYLIDLAKKLEAESKED